MNRIPSPTEFFEFFAGGGMARAGLGAGWRCLFANEIDARKGEAYVANWGSGELRIENVAALTTADLPGMAMLVWASWPCTDLSLAGDRAGLVGECSGTFWPFWRLMMGLASEGRAPPLIALENVCGLLTSRGGQDFAAIGDALASGGYRFGAVVIDAAHFVPQSRERVFIISAHRSQPVPDALLADGPGDLWHPSALLTAYGALSAEARDAWLWWRLPVPPIPDLVFGDIIEDEPRGVEFHAPHETVRLLELMSPINQAKVAAAKTVGRRMVGGLYKRMRDEDGRRVQRAEIRFDDVAGCLRMPTGGSSRQTIMIVEGDHIRSRLLSPREAARLMGLPDNYKLPANYNEPMRCSATAWSRRSCDSSPRIFSNASRARNPSRPRVR
jgi:DNA (cytosine-5)-methyltransferase 1